jgi:hypothetical protein
MCKHHNDNYSKRFLKGSSNLILPSFSNSSPCALVKVHASIVGFRASKHVMKKGIITFKSYLETS